MDAVLKTEDFLKRSADPFDECAFASTRQSLNHMPKRFCIRRVNGAAANFTCFKQAAIQNQPQNLELLGTRRICFALQCCQPISYFYTCGNADADISLSFLDASRRWGSAIPIICIVIFWSRIDVTLQREGSTKMPLL